LRSPTANIEGENRIAGMIKEGKPERLDSRRSLCPRRRVRE